MPRAADSPEGRARAPAPPADQPVSIDEPWPGVRRVMLNRPGRRNAVDARLLEALVAAMVDPPPAVVLATADPQAFCGGVDLDVSDADRAAISDGLYDLYERIIVAPAVVVVALRGAAVGAGAQLAIAADLRIAHPDAWLRFPGVGHGLAVGAWGLPSLVGRGRAMRLCTLMERIGADLALDWGLVDDVRDDPDAAALTVAREIAGRDASALQRVKRVVTSGARLHETLAAERRGNQATWSGSTAGLDDPRRPRSAGH